MNEKLSGGRAVEIESQSKKKYLDYLESPEALDDLKKFLLKMGASRVIAQKEVDDITQDILERACQRIDNFREEKGGGGFFPWLHTIARNRYIDYYRKNKRAATHHLTLLRDAATATNTNTDEADFNRRIDKVKMGTVIDEALRQLPPLQRRILELFYFEGLSQKQIAEKMNIRATATVATRLAKARASLRILLPPAIAQDLLDSQE